MSKDLVAKANVSINATRDKVWAALVTPAAIRQYMFGADVAAHWRKGGAITWKGEMKGKKYEDKGVILEFEPEKTLQYSHFSPLFGKPDKPENYHTVTIELSGTGQETEVSLTQDNNGNKDACKESEKKLGRHAGRLKKIS